MLLVFALSRQKGFCQHHHHYKLVMILDLMVLTMMAVVMEVVMVIMVVAIVVVVVVVVAYLWCLWFAMIVMVVRISQQRHPCHALGAKESLTARRIPKCHILKLIGSVASFAQSLKIESFHMMNDSFHLNE